MSKDKIWRCEDGREIPVEDMSISHMQSVLRYLAKQGYDVPKNILSLAVFELRDEMRKQIRALGN